MGGVPLLREGRLLSQRKRLACPADNGQLRRLPYEQNRVQCARLALCPCHLAQLDSDESRETPHPRSCCHGKKGSLLECPGRVGGRFADSGLLTGARARNGCIVSLVRHPVPATHSRTALIASSRDEQIGHSPSRRVTLRISLSLSDTPQKTIRPLQSLTRFHSLTKNPSAVEP